MQLNDARQVVQQWAGRYRQRCWLRQLTPHANRDQEDKLLRVIARMNGTPFPTTARLTGRWLRGRLPTLNDWLRGIPVLDRKVREQTQRRKQQQRTMGLATAYCAETVAITYEEMGLLVTDKDAHWFDPGKFWSGDSLPLAPGYRLGHEIAVDVGG
ncbi:adenylate and guanylate cyclase catalytic domain-containing protein [Mycobacterium tuberculosis]|uniref:Adenylate and guanylate cyclase catalytic domain-containing protein n=1 Tax=Mycobacterium tuberculosis TaxID=1773 RepID=A0A655I3S5_MYCTX|nr:adenylate and guanylate cyclase catalytic domain-containing protein [Mycobacterium tuberculosis]